MQNRRSTGRSGAGAPATNGHRNHCPFYMLNFRCRRPSSTSLTTKNKGEQVFGQKVPVHQERGQEVVSDHLVRTIVADRTHERPAHAKDLRRRILTNNAVEMGPLIQWCCDQLVQELPHQHGTQRPGAPRRQKEPVAGKMGKGHDVDRRRRHGMNQGKGSVTLARHVPDGMMRGKHTVIVGRKQEIGGHADKVQNVVPILVGLRLDSDSKIGQDQNQNQQDHRSIERHSFHYRTKRGMFRVSRRSNDLAALAGKMYTPDWFLLHSSCLFQTLGRVNSTSFLFGSSSLLFAAAGGAHVEGRWVR
jgi:hypothetical protein